MANNNAATKNDLIRPQGDESNAVFVARLIEATNLDQASFAKHIGTVRQSVNAVAAGRRSITPDMAWRLQAALGCDGKALLRRQASSAFDALKPADYKKIKRIGRVASPKRDLKPKVRITKSTRPTGKDEEW